MKKMFVTVLVTLMVMAATMNVANAELRMKAYKVDTKKAAVLHDGTVVWDRIYYAKVTTDVDDRVVEVSKDEYEKLEKEMQDATSEQKGFFANVASVVTFWNPND